ncbi:MAG: hypothetical protein ACD_9C00166G0002 [uncultured bacterium]|nr:MAG: hypothetical protein ACD_9C00166G0002 [uncultured bacterium]
MKKILFSWLIISLLLVSPFLVDAEQYNFAQVDYRDQYPVDYDLDGLTDEGEVQIYGTDPKKSDTDDDGYYDGVEIIAGSDATDKISIPGFFVNNDDSNLSGQDEVPWAWYISRASGLVAFLLLYVSIFLGLTIRVSFLRKFFAPLYAMSGHCWISLQATVLALFHGLILIFDKFLGVRLIDVFVPFTSYYEKVLVALGVIGFYLMLILVVTSYARKFISHKIWRILHFTNIILYVFVILHAYLLGTDIQNPIVRNIFVYANILLILIMLINMFSRIKEKIARRNMINDNQEKIS